MWSQIKNISPAGVRVCAANQFNNKLIAKSTTQKHLKWFTKYKRVSRLIKMKHFLLCAINKDAIIQIIYPLVTTVKGDLRLCKVICLHTMKIELINEINVFVLF